MTKQKATLNVTITGTDIEEVQAMVLALAAKLGGENIARVEQSATEARAEVEVTQATKPEPEKAAEPEPEKAAEPEPEGVVKDLTPDEARTAGIKEVQAHFAENPGCLDEITAIQKKYGVKMFTEITDAKALDFLADVRLLTAGAATA